MGELLIYVLNIYHVKTLLDGDYLEGNVIIHIRMGKRRKEMEGLVIPCFEC